MTALAKPEGSLRRIQSVKLGDQVAGQIRDAIMSGVFVGGEKLLVESLASRLGVSTMPVREALVALAHEGLLNSNPGRGFRVANLTKQDIEDIFLVHAFISGLLAERAVATARDTTIERLRRVTEKVDRLAASGGSEESRSKIEFLNYSFHRTINQLVDAPRLHWFLRAATQYVPRHMFETMPAWTNLTVSDHPAILAALEARNGSLLRERVEMHAIRAGQLIIDNLEERGFWSDPADQVRR
jgi:DNA-binding GntR family transcriptional regulator